MPGGVPSQEAALRALSTATVAGRELEELLSKLRTEREGAKRESCDLLKQRSKREVMSTRERWEKLQGPGSAQREKSMKPRSEPDGSPASPDITSKHTTGNANAARSDLLSR